MEGEPGNNWQELLVSAYFGPKKGKQTSGAIFLLYFIIIILPSKIGRSVEHFFTQPFLVERSVPLFFLGHPLGHSVGLYTH